MDRLRKGIMLSNISQTDKDIEVISLIHRG